MKTILIMMDTLNRNMLRVYEPGAKALTPNIDRLAGRSMVFDSHFIGSAPCMPARRDTLTGRLNFLERNWGPVEPYDVTLPRLLRAQEVFTHIVTDHSHYTSIGGEGYLQQYDTWDFQRGQETDVWESRIEEPPAPGAHLGRLGRQYQWNRQHYKTDADRPTPRTFAAAVDWLKKNERSDDYYLTVEAFDPHEPFDASEEFKAMYPDSFEGFYEWPRYDELNEQETPEAVEHLCNQYCATLTMADKWLGRLLDEMDRQNLWEDTLVIFTSDHGHMLGEHGVTGKNRYHAWNEMSRIPLFVHLPGDENAGERVAGVTQNIDIFPTILEYFSREKEERRERAEKRREQDKKELAGRMFIPPGWSMPVQGRSLWPLLKKEKEKIRDYAIYGWYGMPVNITDGEYTYFRAAANDRNAPLYLYAAGLTSFEQYLGCSMPEESISTGYYLKNVPMPVYRLDMSRKTPEKPFMDLGENRLYRITDDPGQMHPITDPALEEKYCRALVEVMREHDAPEEQFERLGLI